HEVLLEHTPRVHSDQLAVAGSETCYPCFRRRTKETPKRLDKRTRLSVTDREAHLFHRSPANQQLHRFREPRLSSPRIEIKANFVPEDPLNRPHAHARVVA